jgi:prepilin-type processing-associated H-X9-DG protein
MNAKKVCDRCGLELTSEGEGKRCPACGYARGTPAPLLAIRLESESVIRPRTRRKSVGSFLLGILSFAFWIFAGIPAMVLGFRALKEIERSEGRIAGTDLASSGIVFAALSFVIIPLLAWPLRSARQAAGSARCLANLQDIGLAIHRYHAAARQLPPADIGDEQGNPLLSWRVLLLPFLREDELFEEFHLDEPWDSPHNKGLLERMPPVYSERDQGWGAIGLTRYQVFVGPGTLFEPKAVVRLADVDDGKDNTLMVVEASDPVPWTKPADLVFGPGKPLPRLGGIHSGGVSALFADGGVRFLKQSIAERDLHAIITRNGGEPVEEDAMSLPGINRPR